MNFIKSFIQTLHPKIIIHHFQTTEKTENEIIKHEFLCFDAKNLTIDSIFKAKILSKKMGQRVFPFLDKLAKNIKSKEQSATILKAKAWVYKKAVWHPKLVEKCTHRVLKKMKTNGALKNIPLSYKEIHTDASIAAILHDIGRLSEVDIMQGKIVRGNNRINKSHAAISYDILQYAKIKPEILLAIRYHEFATMEEAKEDEIYKTLPEKRKIIAEFYIKLLQDMDKTGNLVERSVSGAKKSAEYFSPEHIKDYDLTDEYLKIAMSGIYLPVQKGHLLDVMVHYITWGYDAHYKETGEILVSILSNIFSQIYKEAWDEYRHSEDKNSIRLANTLEKITKLEDYAIFERTGIKINERNRRKIKEQIKRLRQ